MSAIIIQILEKIKKDQLTIKWLKKERKKEQKLLDKLEDRLIHQQEFSKTLQNYVKKIIKEYKIDPKNAEKDLKKGICFTCPHLFHSIEKLVKNNQEKDENNSIIHKNK